MRAGPQCAAVAIAVAVAVAVDMAMATTVCAAGTSVVAVVGVPGLAVPPPGVARVVVAPLARMAAAGADVSCRALRPGCDDACTRSRSCQRHASKHARLSDST